MRSIFIILISFSISNNNLFAQGDNNQYKNLNPEFRRQLNHDHIDREQKSFVDFKKAADVKTTEETNFFINQSIEIKADEIQFNIEKDSVLDHRLKVQYLHGLSNVLKFINNNRGSTSYSLSYIPATIAAYENLIKIDRARQSIEPAIDDLPYEVGNAVMKANIFEQNKGYNNSRHLLIKKYVTLYPDQILQTLVENPGLPFLDSLVKVAAYN